MDFIPYYDKILVEPLKEKSIIASEDKDLIEVGIVVKVGEAVKFVKPGDTVFFDSWGCSKHKDQNGIERYILQSDSNVIHGKYESKE